MNTGNATWAVRLPSAKAQTAGALRLRTGIEVTQTADAVWLRGAQLTDELVLELRQLPGGERFAVDANGTLTRDGSPLPKGMLPDADWCALSSWFVPNPQTAALPGHLGRRVTPQLVRTDRELPASVLATTLPQWTDYGISAPRLRLNALRFAVADDARTLVRGQPLPPLAGRRYVEQEGIAVPCGWGFSPALDPASLRSLLGSAPADLILFDEDGSFDRIGAEDFVRASRAGARATAAANVP